MSSRRGRMRIPREVWAVTPAQKKKYEDKPIWILGFLEPGDMPRKIAQHCHATGQAAPTTHGEYTRTILESLALRYRQVLEGLETLSGRRIEVIHIVGGGSRNHVLNQFVADCTGRQVVAGPG